MTRPRRKVVHVRGDADAEQLLTVAIRVEADVFVARQRGRALAQIAGLDTQDQVRFATALSEVARELLTHTSGAVAVFAVAAGPSLVVELTAAQLSDSDRPAPTGLERAARLVDYSDASLRDGRAVVTLAKRMPGWSEQDREHVAELRERVRALAPASAMDDLAEQNAQLLAALGEVEAKQQALMRVNEELEETNRGVLALYDELSQELERTNQGVVALYADLDETSTRLRQAHAAKNRLAANISHELRAPLSSVLGLTRLLLDEDSGPLSDDQRLQLRYIRGSCSDLLELVSDLLRLAKAEAGRLTPTFGPVNVAAVLARIQGTLAPTTADRDVALVVTAAPDLAEITTDETMLTHILRNLVTNGLKFTSAGEVRVTAARAEQEGMAEFAVSDTGIGIAPQDRDRVFEEFYQVPTRLQANVTGTGLGLPYARQLAVLLGGELTVDSVVGQGSVFTLRLPITPDVSSAAAPVRPEAAGGRGEPAVRALVVASDSHALDGLARTLAGAGVNVRETSADDDAIALARAHRPDVVFVDMRPTDTRSAAVFADLRTDPLLADVPVVVVTADDGGDAPPRVLGAFAVCREHELTATRVAEILESVRPPNGAPG